MAIAHVQSTAHQGTGASVAKAFASNVTAGNAIIVGVTSFSAALNAGSCTDSLGNTYTRLAAPAVDGSVQTTIYYAMNIAGGACTVTITPGDSGDVSLVISEFSGLATSSMADQSATGTPNSTTPATAATGTTAQADELVYGVGGHSGAAATISPGGTFTQAAENESVALMPISGEYKIVSAVATYTADWTLSAARTWVCMVGTFKAAGVAATKACPFPQRPYRVWMRRV